MRQPTSSPVSAMTAIDERVEREVGGRPADQHRRVRHRQRPEPVDQALLQVVGEAAPVIVLPKITVCAKMPGSRNSA